MTEHIAHIGAWRIALIVIMVASWLLYRYLAPMTLEGVGLVTTFILSWFAGVLFAGLNNLNLGMRKWK
jgi:hypothetical protein